MASTSVVAEPVHEIPHWLKTLPVAPEFHPTVAEFEDPISYILKIEKQASRYGICKIVPPVSLPSKKTTISNLNRSLASKNPNSRPTFTTRYQQIGFDPRKGRPVQKPVWQSGEYYTLQGFETHAKLFEKNYLKKCGKKSYSALEIETLFWRASVDKPFTVEYANDMPGSAFVPLKSNKCLRETGDGVTVGDTEWNMRGVARSKGSLLRFMKEEIPGVTSPMVYIAMLFSWFAWHVEDHDLHSLNYMHMGAPKTWYGVPKDAAFAFQDVVRVQGYGGDFNPLVTFATLGEKTTVMSPEVLIGAGIPCCRLVQNVGDFVVTFPGAYHSGFSHGFNFAEASNIATPEWLRFAKEAAIRRASINCAPMVSHYQLLYALALALCSRVPMSISNEPRSSRLKDKKRGEGEGMVKEFFLRSMMQNNELLHILSSNGSPCVLLPRHTSDMVPYSNGGIGTQKVKQRMLLGFCSNSEASKCSRTLVSDEETLEKNVQPKHLTSLNAANETSNPMFMGDSIASPSVKQSQLGNVDWSCSVIIDTDITKNSTTNPTGPLEQARFPCVQCGILSFACAAVIQPREAAAQYLMSADSSFFSEWNAAGSGVLENESIIPTETGNSFELNCSSSVIENAGQDGLYDVPVKSGDYQIEVFDKEHDGVSRAEAQEGISSLALLASAYGNSSDSDEERVEPEMAIGDENIGSQSLSGDSEDGSRLHVVDPDCSDGVCGSISHFPFCQNGASAQNTQCTSYSRRKRKQTSCDVQSKTQQASDCCLQSDDESLVPMKFSRLEDSCRDTEVLSGRVIAESSEISKTLYTNHIEAAPADFVLPSPSYHSKFSQAPLHGEIIKYCNIDPSTPRASISLMQISNEESCRKHIFCLPHAVEVEKKLRSIGGADILLLCHPEYPKVEETAKSLAQDLGIDHIWKDTSFKNATREDQEIISLALYDEEADPSNGDWAVKLGINLYHSVRLSKSPLYTKQMPHNPIIYEAFGCSSTNSPLNTEVSGKVPGRQKKVVVAGNWCGKVWMSNQVHPDLNQRENKEDDLMGYHIRRTPSLRSCPEVERKVEINQPVISEKRSLPRLTTTITRKLGKKKKTKSRKLATKKEETPEPESPTQSGEDYLESDSSLLSNTRFLRDGKTELERPVPQKSRVKNMKQYHLNSVVRVDGRSSVAGKRGPKKKSKPANEETEFERSPQLESRSQTPEASSESGFDSDSFPLSNGRFHKGSTVTQYGLSSKDETEGGPSTRLRRRPSKPVEEKTNPVGQKLSKAKRVNKPPPNGIDTKDEEGEYQCDIEGCTMSFSSKQELVLHKKNICSFKGCGKKFFSHKYLVQHRRVHSDDRPLKCPWKGCSMTFKWAWARTEHIRVHTGDRPYKCGEKGCGQTFRFVSDFSRHKRKTGHKGKGKK